MLAVAVGGGGSIKKHARTLRLNQLDPPKQFPLDRMRLSLRDLLVIGPPHLIRHQPLHSYVVSLHMEEALTL